MTFSRKRLPDLCVIVLLQQMPVNDQLRAGRVNARWFVLLRAANRRVRSLTINCNSLLRVPDNTWRIKVLLKSLPDVRVSLLTDSNLKPLYSLSPVTKWNCLHLRITLNKNEFGDGEVFHVYEIANAFSAVTELAFFSECSFHFKFLADLQKSLSNWDNQVPTFALCDTSCENRLSHRFIALSQIIRLEHL